MRVWTPGSYGDWKADLTKRRRSRRQGSGGRAASARVGVLGPPRRSDWELAAWALAGLIVGAAIGVTTLVAYLVMVLVLAAIVRMYLEKTERNIRPSLGMVPVFTGSYGIGLFLRALGG